MKYALVLAGILACAIAGYYIRKEWFPPSGSFVSTYYPKGWTIQERDVPFGLSIVSPDYHLEDPYTLPDCSGNANEGCAMGDAGQILTSGSYFHLGWDPCLYGTTVSEFRQRDARNHDSYRNLIDQTQIRIAGHPATLFHTQQTTNTKVPQIEDYYEFTVITAPPDCQIMQFGFVESSTTDYKAELPKFIDGLRFFPGLVVERPQ